MHRLEMDFYGCVDWHEQMAALLIYTVLFNHVATRRQREVVAVVTSNPLQNAGGQRQSPPPYVLPAQRF